ncbi:MAG TPA: hypothetical protein VGM03_20970 [Phycisphaerae bacterium]|jgi:antitoxin ParD1/3/4
MATVNITLPDELKQFVQSQSVKDGYASEAEYLRVIIQQARELEVEHELEAELLETAAAAGREITTADWQSLKERIRQQRLDALRAELDIGLKQLERGEYATYTTETLGELFDRIQSEGRKRLASMTSKSD